MLGAFYTLPLKLYVETQLSNNQFLTYTRRLFYGI